MKLSDFGPELSRQARDHQYWEGQQWGKWMTTLSDRFYPEEQTMQKQSTRITVDYSQTAPNVSGSGTCFVTLTRTQVEQALKDLNEPTIAPLQRVRSRRGLIVREGVVIIGVVQRMYIATMGGPEYTFTVVIDTGTGDSYRTASELLSHWEPVA